MIRKVLPALFLAIAISAAWAQHVPGDGAPYVDPGFELQGHGRLFYDAGDLEGMVEYLVRYDTDQLRYNLDRVDIYNGFAAGGYYRVHENVKLGAFYRLQFGARHDEDWIEASPEWIWRDTSNRAEHVLMGDVTPRFLLDFLPGENWVLAVKNRYEVTMYRQDGEFFALQSLLVRPGLTYFVMRDREPVVNLALQYATYWSLNFGESPWYRHGPYLSIAYHLAPGLQIDLNLGAQFIYWTESAEFDLAWPNNRYLESVYRPWTVDLGVIYKIRR